MKKFGFFRSSDINYIDSQLALLGNSKHMSASTFMWLRILSTLIVFFLVLFLFDYGYIFGVVGAFIWYNVFYMFLSSKIKVRAEILEHDALDFFEILTLTLESGRNLEVALETTVFNVNSELSEEFKKTLFELKFGKPLIDAFNDMRLRIPSDLVNNIILNIVQSNRFGNGILNTMYDQIDFLRDKQLLSVREKINKIPNRVSIISVIFIIPIILIIILGPYLIRLVG